MKIEMDLCGDEQLEKVGTITIEGEWDNPKFRAALLRWLTNMSTVSYNSSVETITEETP